MLYFFRLIATAEIYTLSLHDALPIWDVHPLGEEHLHADEGQHQAQAVVQEVELVHQAVQHEVEGAQAEHGDRKSTRLNSSHSQISYAVFCLKKKIRN